MPRFVIGIALAFILASTAQAQLIFPIEQQRQMSSWVQVNDPNQTSDSAIAEAPDMLPWVQDIEAYVDSCEDGCSLAGGAGQYSDISDTTLTAYGVADVSAVHNYNWALDGAAIGTNSYRVQFAVATPVNYELSGFISVETGYTGEPANVDWETFNTVDVRLDQIAGPTVHEQHAWLYSWPDPNSPTSDFETLAAAGQLSPGVYELEVVADVECPYLYLESYGVLTELFAEASFVVDLEFSPAEPPAGCEQADIDDDGDVDLIDFFRFQNCYTGP